MSRIYTISITGDGKHFGRLIEWLYNVGYLEENGFNPIEHLRKCRTGSLGLCFTDQQLAMRCKLIFGQSCSISEQCDDMPEIAVVYVNQKS